METVFPYLKEGFRKAKNLDLTCGVATVVSVSVILFITTAYTDVSRDVFSLDTNAVLKGHVHKLFTYSILHADAGQLLLSAGALALLASGLERGVGTVRFLYLLPLLSACAGLLHVLLELLMFGAAGQGCVCGLIPAALSLLGVSVAQSAMRRSLLLGINVPSIAVPWVLLFVAQLVPGSVFLCNACAVTMGEMYGKGWFAFLKISEVRACILDKKAPFRLLKQFPGVTYVPASSEERRKTLHTPCRPAPGSYPVQAYATVAAFPPLQAAPQTYGGWQHLAYAQARPVPSVFHHGPSAGHQYSHWQTVAFSEGQWSPGGANAHCHSFHPASPSHPGCVAAPLAAPAGIPASSSGPTLASMITPAH